MHEARNHSGIKRAIHAQVYEEFGVISHSVVIQGVPNEVE